MKQIERNLSRHANGMIYVIARRGGKLEVKSLKTKDLKEARRLLREFGVHGLLANSPPLSAPAPAPPVFLQPVPEATEATKPDMTLAEALELHRLGMVLNSQGAREMESRCRRVVLEKAPTWAEFEPVVVWSSYRNAGRKGSRRRLQEKDEAGHRLPVPLTSAANHMRWFLRSFVPWAVEQGCLQPKALKSLAKIKKIKVDSREIRVPSVEAIGELLSMVATEDPNGGEYLRFLASSGLRRGGALGLTWERIDFEGRRLRGREKGGALKGRPLTPEALAVLQARKNRGLSRPFEFNSSELDKLKRRLTRFAKGMDMDLTYYHAFRHYFASRALMAGMSPKEVAELLGHSDGGVLVLRTYGHLCSDHLRQATDRLRLVG